MKNLPIIITFLFFIYITSKELSQEYLTYQENLVKKINSLKTTWKAELYPEDIRPLLGVLINPETNNFYEDNNSCNIRIADNSDF